MRRILSSVALFLGILTPQFVLAQRSVTITAGIRASLPVFLESIVWFLATSSLALCTLMFLIGAFLFVVSHGNESTIQRGKQLMVNAILGLMIILGAYAILRTVLYVLVI